MTTEEKREEERIRKINRPIYEWAEKVYQLFEDFDDIYHLGTPPPWLFRLADPQVIRNTQEQFPNQSIQSAEDIRSFMSQLVYYWGSRGMRHQVKHGRNIVSGAMINMALEIVAFSMKTEPSKLKKLIDTAKPLLYRHDKKALQSLHLTPEVESLLPAKFFESPSEFIEKAPLLDQKVSMKHPGYPIVSLSNYPYDWTAERVYKSIIFHRAHLLHLSYATVQIKEMEKVKQRAEDFADFKLTARPYTGYLCDAGNFYLVTNYIPHVQNLYSKWRNDNRYKMIHTYFLKYDIEVNPWDILITYKDERMLQGQETGYVVVDYRPRNHDLHI